MSEESLLAKEVSELNWALTELTAKYQQEMSEKENLAKMVDEYKLHVNTLTEECQSSQQKLFNEIWTKREKKEKHE